MTTANPVLSVVVCGAGPAADVGTLVRLALGRGWTVQVIATPSLSRPASAGKTR